jgi:hypothetical protein
MRYINSFRALMAACSVALSPTGLVVQSHAQKLGHGLIVVSPNKMPAETHQPGIAMTLHLVDPQTLYLYVEEQDIRKLAVYDVTDPGKIKLKKITQLNAAGTYDFVQSAGPSLELIRYRQSGHLAVLDLSKPKEPILSEVDSVARWPYIVPRKLANSPNLSGGSLTDYVVLASASSQPLWTIKGVLQEATDSGNDTTYLLGRDGLTEIRDIQAERRLAASAPHWTNTIDDN